MFTVDLVIPSLWVVSFRRRRPRSSRAWSWARAASLVGRPVDGDQQPRKVAQLKAAAVLDRVAVFEDLPVPASVAERAVADAPLVGGLVNPHYLVEFLYRLQLSAPSFVSCV